MLSELHRLTMELSSKGDSDCRLSERMDSDDCFIIWDSLDANYLAESETGGYCALKYTRSLVPSCSRGLSKSLQTSGVEKLAQNLSGRIKHLLSYNDRAREVIASAKCESNYLCDVMKRVD